jgi:hypothetical protein
MPARGRDGNYSGQLREPPTATLDPAEGALGGPTGREAFAAYTADICQDDVIAAGSLRRSALDRGGPCHRVAPPCG